LTRVLASPDVEKSVLLARIGKLPSPGLVERLAFFVRLPDEEKFFIAGRSQAYVRLPGSAAKGRPNVFLGIRKLVEGNLQSSLRTELSNISQQLSDYLLVFAFSTFWDIDLENRLKSHGMRRRITVARHDSLLDCKS
jgi:hypothetical protein